MELRRIGMARKTIGYVKLAWTCPHCDGENHGPRKFCNGCGAPQPQDVEFHQAAQEVLLTDEAEIARAKAGPDIHCPYCRARNPGDASFCSACGGSLESGEARPSGAVLGAYRKDKQLDIECPSCATLNPANAHTCAGCGDSLAKPKPASREIKEPKKRTPVGIALGIGALCLIAGIVWIFLSQRTEEHIGTVEDVAWMRSIPVEALVDIEDEGWMDEIHADAEIGPCTDKHRETVAEPVPDSVEVCGTPYTVDIGTGIGEVVQDCEYEVFSDWCTYTVIDWGIVDSVTLTGTDFNPIWPEAQLTEGQRFGDGEERFEITLSTDDDTYTYTIYDSVVFIQFQQGTTWILNINSFGQLVSVDKPE
jgi:predicted nucleic acid-binding Zn ribbon protein